MVEKVFSTKIQDHIINNCRKKKIPVTIFLKNGQILKGRIESFDQFTIDVEVKTQGKIVKRPSYELVYKSSILTIVLGKKVHIGRDRK
ncbi:MAG: RNA chaperone Hfq [Candidatus Muirbacterium halophilum]|nr:RNA chaperone Hfq [Candidatus Muirbacterium halophilum]MCK9474404.1 RNA chaperone Hfq [Candidatus Muirbacterium halophilum]